MSNNNLGILLNSNSKNPQRQRGKSQNSLHKIPEIITQVKPLSLNNFSNPINLHKSSFTPSNKTRDILQPNLLLPQKSLQYINKKTLILDLDETLVHSSTSYTENSDVTLNVDFEGIFYNIYVFIRPGAENFIKKISKYYEIVIFTASISKYASPLLDKLDPEKNIKYRLYREQCTFLNGIYIKELKRLNRDLKDIIIVDNSPLAYAFDLENGLPIKSWYEDKNDNELENIFPLLEFLSDVDDVRDYIGLFVENNQIKYDQANKIISAFNNIENINNIKDEDNKDNNNTDKNNNEENKKDNNINIKSNNIVSLHDLLSSIKKNKDIGNIINKNILKANIEDKSNQKNIPILKIGHNNQNKDKNKDKEIDIDKKDNNNNMINNNMNNNNINNINKNNNNIFIENIKIRKTSFRNKKNAFRLNKKLDQMSLKNLPEKDNNKKINTLFPLTLSLTNSTKMINFKNRGKNMNNLKLISIKDISNNNSSKKDLKDSHIYTNLLGKLKNNNTSLSLTNNINTKNNNKKTILIRNTKSFKIGKHKNLLIHAPFINQQGFLPINNNFTKYLTKTSRSKSTGNFMEFNNKKEHTKASKSNQKLFNLELYEGKNGFKFGYENGLKLPKFNQTTMRKFTPSLIPTKNKIKIKKLGIKKNM